MTKRLFALIMVVALSLSVFGVMSFGAFDGYAIRFNN